MKVELSQQVNPPSIFRLRDGRNLAYESVGDPQGKPVFFFHGSPGSRLESLPAETAAIKHSLHIIAVDRAGMGKSDFKPGYSLLEYTNDIRELADGLGFDTFGVMGHSGGGATVLSCAYALSERLNFALDLGGWVPVIAPELRTQMTSLDRFFANLCIPIRRLDGENTVPPIFKFLFTLLGLGGKVLSPAIFVRLLYQSQYFCDADFAILSAPESARFLVQTVRESFSQGSQGPAYDALLRYQNWGFELADISFPVQIFHGMDDLCSPYRFAEYKHQHLPHSKLHSYPNEGHFFLWSHWEEIFEIALTPDED